MSRDTTSAECVTPPWLLTASAFERVASSLRWPLTAYSQRRILAKVKLYNYTNVAYELEHVYGRAIALAILREYFDKPNATGYTLDLEVEVCNLVQAQCFPIDWSLLDDAYNSGEDAFAYPMAYKSWGIAWEMSDEVTVMYEYAIPLLVALSDAIELTSDWQEEHVEALYCMIDSLHDMLVLNGFHGDLTSWSTRCEYKPHALKQIRERFDQLDAPFDGLTPLSHALLHDRKNVFLDMPQYWRADYEYDIEYWSPDGIERLATAYLEVREEIEKLEAYVAWFERTPDAIVKVSEVIETVVSTLEGDMT